MKVVLETELYLQPQIEPQLGYVYVGNERSTFTIVVALSDTSRNKTVVTRMVTILEVDRAGAIVKGNTIPIHILREHMFFVGTCTVPDIKVKWVKRPQK